MPLPSAKIEGQNLILTIPMNPSPLPPSKSRKSLLVATSEGNQKTALTVQGKTLVVSVNAYIAA